MNKGHPRTDDRKITPIYDTTSTQLCTTSSCHRKGLYKNDQSRRRADASRSFRRTTQLRYITMKRTAATRAVTYKRTSNGVRADRVRRSDERHPSNWRPWRRAITMSWTRVTSFPRDSGQFSTLYLTSSFTATWERGV